MDNQLNDFDVNINTASDQGADNSVASRPNDPLLSGNWALDAVDAFSAWQVATGEDIVIAVVDTGVDVNHKDLDDNIWVNKGEIAGDGIDNDGNGFIDDVNGWNFTNDGAANNPNDVHSHGTHVAGIIAAEADNGYGIAGVAPDAEIMAVKVLNDRGSGSSSDVAAGIRYAVDNGADIVNLSLGSSRLSSSIEAAVEYAQANGVLVVAAAGNSGRSEAGYPARLTESLDNVISVAATDKNGKVASFSNYSESGTTVDLAAPGVSIRSTTPDDRFGNKSGTSMATPVVAAAAAVIWSANPEWTYDQVIEVLESTVSDLANTSKPNATNGILDLGAAMEKGGVIQA